MMANQRILELLAKKKLNNAALADIEELNGLCQLQQINLKELNKFDDILTIQFTVENTPTQVETLNNWEKFNSKFIQQQDQVVENPIHKIGIKKYWYLAIAAILIIALTFGFLNLKSFFVKPNQLNIVSTQNGSKSKIQMPDGTQVCLNSGSTLTYDDSFGVDQREVNLVGEAFFDVAHDAKRPFIIHTENLTLKVLGTAFNVKAYHNAPNSEATLIRGSLEVSFPSRPQEKIVLKPNEKISISNKNSQNLKQLPKQSEKNLVNLPLIALTQVEPISFDNQTIEEIAWKENQLIFRSRNFEDLTLELERWYNLKIEIKNNNIKDKKFTGIFKNETIFEALDALRLSYAFDYSFDKKSNIITIY
jgi:ferric-dicitrate binding protein FerR (iron transport regulator)